VVNLRSGIAFDDNLLLLADTQQFSFGSGDASLTSTSAAVTVTTRYEADPDCDPVAAGSNIYFVNPRDDYISIREYGVQPDSLIEDAADVTAHVPKYIPNGNITMEVCHGLDMLFVNSSGDDNAIFIYKYYWVGNEKPQSAWSKWTFNGTITGMIVVGSILYVVIKRTGDTCLEKIELENVATLSDFDFRVNLDRLTQVTGSYSSSTELTTWDLPYDGLSSETYQVINPNTGVAVPGATLNATTDKITATGDYSDDAYTIGIVYEASYTMSEWYMKNSKTQTVTEGRLQIRFLTLSFTNTGYFEVQITPYNRNTLTHKFTGTIIGVSTIGEPAMVSGEEKFLIMAKSKQTSIKIVSESYLPFQIQTGAFEGYYSVRSTIL
jgi:hypothetical protein